MPDYKASRRLPIRHTSRSNALAFMAFVGVAVVPNLQVVMKQSRAAHPSTGVDGGSRGLAGANLLGRCQLRGELARCLSCPASPGLYYARRLSSVACPGALWLSLQASRFQTRWLFENYGVVGAREH